MPTTKTKTPKETKVDQAVGLFTRLLQYRIILNNHSKVANSNLPKKKVPKHVQLLADWMIKVKNTERALADIYPKLTSNQKHEFAKRTKASRP